MKQLRNKKISLAFTPFELAQVDALRDKKQLINIAKVSRVDTIVEAVQFANGSMPLK